MRHKIITAIICTLITTIHTQLIQADEIIAYWSFNSRPPDNKIVTGSLAPAIGRGRVALVGGVISSFAQGDPSDPSADNSALNTTGYPPKGESNKTAGVEFYVNTKGFYNITVSLQGRANSTASRVARLQITTDGSNFVDSVPFPIGPANEFSFQTNWFFQQWQCNDNTNFGIRVVSEFLFTASGKEPHEYVTSTEYPYSPGGSLRLDEVYVWGQRLNFDPVPQASYPGDIVTEENVPVIGMPFDVADSITPASDLIVLISSSNELLLPRENLLMQGTSTNRTLTMTPARNQAGIATVTINVSNRGGQYTRREFRLIVTPRGTTPSMAPIPHQLTMINTPVTIPITINPWTNINAGPFFACYSSNPSLTPPPHMVMGGEGTNRSLTITPGTNQVGTALIHVQVTDGYRTASNSFVLTVLPSTNIIACENFDYPGAPLVTNARNYWLSHSGTAGQIPVIEGQIWLVQNLSEDVNLPLLGAPYTTQRGAILYAAFNVNMLNLPSASGQFFAHYNASGFKGRVFATTAGAAPDLFYRIGIANSTTDSVQFPADLLLFESYRVVTRYNVGTGETTLWIDPRTESDPSVTATDALSPSSITSYAFRQNAGIGTLSIDDLKVGTSFPEVASRSRPNLTVRGVLNHAEISWIGDLTGYVLEEADSITSTNWIPLRGEPPISGQGRRVLQIYNTTGNKFFRLRSTNAPPVMAGP